MQVVSFKIKNTFLNTLFQGSSFVLQTHLRTWTALAIIIALKEALVQFGSEFLLIFGRVLYSRKHTGRTNSPTVLARMTELGKCPQKAQACFPSRPSATLPPPVLVPPATTDKVDRRKYFQPLKILTFKLDRMDVIRAVRHAHTLSEAEANFHPELWDFS